MHRGFDNENRNVLVTTVLKIRVSYPLRTYSPVDSISNQRAFEVFINIDEDRDLALSAYLGLPLKDKAANHDAQTVKLMNVVCSCLLYGR